MDNIEKIMLSGCPYCHNREKTLERIEKYRVVNYHCLKCGKKWKEPLN